MPVAIEVQSSAFSFNVLVTLDDRNKAHRFGIFDEVTAKRWGQTMARKIEKQAAAVKEKAGRPSIRG